MNTYYSLSGHTACKVVEIYKDISQKLLEVSVPALHYIGMVMDYKMGTTYRSNPSMLDAIMWESQGKIFIQNIHLRTSSLRLKQLFRRFSPSYD